MNTITMESRWTRVVRWLIGVVLIWAGWIKLGDPMAFFVTLLTYELPLPDAVLRLVTVSLPWLEIVLGCALLLNLWAQTIRLMAAGLFAVFVIALIQSLLRGLSIDCGCFGSPTWEWMGTAQFALVRASLLFGASCWLVWEACRRTPEVCLEHMTDDGDGENDVFL